MTKITIGARGSKLSIAYVEKVKKLLIQKNTDLKEENIDFKAIKTSGDINQNVKLSEIGGKNLFCKEIEEKLLKKEIDIAVHSLKDMESVEDNNLIIGAYIKRNDYRDVIISNKIKSLEDLKGKIVIGSSSKRRELQLKKINKNISVTSMRGNIDTRIKKLEEGKLDGIILAAAGVKSLHLDNKRNVVNDFCKYFKTQNKNFNSFKFYNACFINEDYNNVAKDINFDEVFLGRVSNQKEGK